MPLARIGLGANLGDPIETIRTAIAALSRCGTVVQASSFYRTKAWGVTDQPDFVNAAIALETDLTPRELLVDLKGIEAELGREPGARWGPRIIDLDILTYDDAVMNEPELTIPHPHLHERAFALVPLAEIDPSFEPALASLPESERESVHRIEP